ncbi:MAG TPA: sigma-54 dependent transcriptional regulator [Bacteroidales bacterium]|nr:sigma-54 dependent transcriptional regulator [Bacteroidales bacterium]HRW96103.1 sigma-54 dependent transcriptional regulator [Bacteroidales bacterium]
MSNFKIFIVEDDPFYGEMLKYHISLNPDYSVEKFQTGKDFLNNLHRNPSVVTLDYTLPDISGLEVLKKIMAYNPNIPVIIVSGQEDVSTAVNLLKEGAYDYFVKNDETKDRIWNSLKKIREKLNLEKEIDSLKEEIGRKYIFGNIIKGNSPGIKKIFSLIEKAIQTNITVSITGETGTGKDLVAKAIHYNSAKANLPFIAINVSAIPKELIESEMFGHEKGAFTGAVTRKIGKFEEAGKGTIFLDEIGEMDQYMQVKLLRVLQEKELNRVGGNEVIKVNARVIIATNRNLAEEVKKGNFRQDLYFRLLGLNINLPPLRDRGNDILLLAKYFVDEFCKENDLQKKSLSQKAQEKLMNYDFPGNVRELKAIMELAVVMANSEVIDDNDISLSAATRSSNFLMDEEDTLQGYDKKIIKHFLEKYDNNILEVAKKLDIGKSTIYRMIKNKEI